MILLPNITIPIPTTTANSNFHTGISFVSSCFSSLFFALFNRYSKYTQKHTIKIIPSIRFRLPSKPNTNNNTVINTKNGISIKHVFFFTANGQIILVIPSIIKIFKRFEPTTFPTAKSALFFNAELILTDASGKLVPIATTVKPITISGIFNFFTWCIIGVLCQAAFGLSFVTYVGGTIVLYAALVIIEIISYQANGGGYTRDFLGNIDKILTKQISSVRLSIKDSTTKHTKAIKQNYLDSLVGLKKHITNPEFMGVDAVKPLKEIGYNAFKKGNVLKDDIKKVIKAILKKLSNLSFGELILFIIEWTFKIFLLSIVIIPLVFLLGTLACFLLPFITTAIIVGAMIAFMAVIFAVLKDIITSIITGKPTNGERKKVNEYRKLIIDKFDELGRKLKANTNNCTFGSMESSFRTGFSEGFDEAWKVHKEDFELDYEE